MYLRLFTYCLLILIFVAYSAAVYTVGTRLPNSIPQASEQALAGHTVFRKYNCGACHQLYGLGGHLGPDLTNVMSNPARGEQYARIIIGNGLGNMPQLNLAPDEVNAVVEYLKFVDTTGESPPRHFDFTWWGSIQLKGKTEE